MQISNFVLKPMLALAVALPVFTTFNVSEADAGSRKRAAIIAGAIIGGAIAYNHYKKRKHYRSRHYGTRYYHRGNYGHRYRHRGYHKHRHYHGGYGHGYYSRERHPGPR